jgi:hypothetical protein
MQIFIKAAFKHQRKPLFNVNIFRVQSKPQEKTRESVSSWKNAGAIAGRLAGDDAGCRPMIE